jgi:hypothetical protein
VGLVFICFKSNHEPIAEKEARKILEWNADGYVWSRVGQTRKEEDFAAHLDGRVAMKAWYAKGGLTIVTKEWAGART